MVPIVCRGVPLYSAPSHRNSNGTQHSWVGLQSIQCIYTYKQEAIDSDSKSLFLNYYLLLWLPIQVFVSYSPPIFINEGRISV